MQCAIFSNRIVRDVKPTPDVPNRTLHIDNNVEQEETEFTYIYIIICL